MIDTKQTLINLHERFPDMDLDDLFAILECIKELYSGTVWQPGTVYCQDQKIY